jgi:hypothetical protein
MARLKKTKPLIVGTAGEQTPEEINNMLTTFSNPALGTALVNAIETTATTGFSQVVGPTIDPDKLSEILFIELVMFKKTNSYPATSVIDLKTVCAETVRKYLE